MNLISLARIFAILTYIKAPEKVFFFFLSAKAWIGGTWKLRGWGAPPIRTWSYTQPIIHINQYFAIAGGKVHGVRDGFSPPRTKNPAALMHRRLYQIS